MFTIDDFTLDGDTDIELDGSEMLNYNLDSFDNIYIFCYLCLKTDSVIAISCCHLHTNNPVYELVTSYTGIGVLEKIESFDKPIDFKAFILEMIDKINNDFNEEAYNYFISDSWFDSDVFNIISKYNESPSVFNNVREHNALVGKLGECSDFEIDPNFKKQYSKHMMLKSDERITLDLDAFFFDRLIKIAK